jgi:ABC-type oligopeptide transport system substrate-binding subunit
VVQESAEVNRFRAGDLDITANIDSAMFAAMLEERPDEVRVSSYLGIFYYGFNLKSELFSNKPGLRRALSMAVDREALVEAITGRGELPAYGWVPPGINGYKSQSLDYSILSKSQREIEARRLYEAAGYSSDNPLAFELRYNTSTVQTRIAVAVQSMWRDVLGVEATFINEEFRVLLSNIQSMQVTEMFRLSWTGDYNDPLTFLQLFESGNPSNLTAYSNPRVDALLKEAAAEVDTLARMALLEEVETTAISEHPVIPLYFYVSKHLVRKNIVGWQDNVLDFHYTQHLRPN